MNETRREILKKLKYLRQNWKETIKVVYPNATTSVYDSLIHFLNVVKRDEHVQRSVMCSNYIEQINVTEIDKKSLLDFISNLPDNAYLNVESYQYYGGYREYTMQAWYYRKETDKEYLHRLKELCSNVEQNIIKKRCDDSEVNSYIEYLEKQLKVKE